MYMHDTNCCAIQEICELSNSPDAFDAMQEFCSLNLGSSTNRFHGYSGTGLYSFYLFTAAFQHDGSGRRAPWGSDWADYGEDFAAFIRDNRLGEVMESPLVRNGFMHADRSNKVYIWTVDEPALRKWWAVNKDQTEPKVSIDIETTSATDINIPPGDIKWAMQPELLKNATATTAEAIFSIPPLDFLNTPRFVAVPQMQDSFSSALSNALDSPSGS
jgi:hypothetical protein